MLRLYADLDIFFQVSKLWLRHRPGHEPFCLVSFLWISLRLVAACAGCGVWRSRSCAFTTSRAALMAVFLSRYELRCSPESSEATVATRELLCILKQFSLFYTRPEFPIPRLLHQRYRFQWQPPQVAARTMPGTFLQVSFCRFPEGCSWPLERTGQAQQGLHEGRRHHDGVLHG